MAWPVAPAARHTTDTADEPALSVTPRWPSKAGIGHDADSSFRIAAAIAISMAPRRLASGLADRIDHHAIMTTQARADSLTQQFHYGDIFTRSRRPIG